MKNQFKLISLVLITLLINHSMAGDEVATGDPIVELSVFSYSCKLTTKSAGVIFNQSEFVFNKDNSSKLTTVGEVKLLLRPHWFDIHPVDFKTEGSVLTRVLLRLPNGDSEAYFPFNQKKIYLFVSSRPSDVSDGKSVGLSASLFCERIK